MRSDPEGKIDYALSNEHADAELERLARGKCQRVFVESANREAKSESGRDKLRARKFSAWERYSRRLTSESCCGPRRLYHD
jgi:hypothetical protein